MFCIIPRYGITRSWYLEHSWIKWIKYTMECYGDWKKRFFCRNSNKHMRLSTKLIKRTLIWGEITTIIARTCRSFQWNVLRFTTNEGGKRYPTSKLVSSYKDNIRIVLAYFKVNPRSSIRSARDAWLHVLFKGSWTIVNYKFTTVQSVKLDYYQKRRNCCAAVLIWMQEDPNF